MSDYQAFRQRVAQSYAEMRAEGLLDDDEPVRSPPSEQPQVTLTHAQIQRIAVDTVERVLAEQPDLTETQIDAIAKFVADVRHELREEIKQLRSEIETMRKGSNIEAIRKARDVA